MACSCAGHCNHLPAAGLAADEWGEVEGIGSRVVETLVGRVGGVATATITIPGCPTQPWSLQLSHQRSKSRVVLQPQMRPRQGVRAGRPVRAGGPVLAGREVSIALAAEAA